MSIPFANAFAGKSVFVTGHTGFKGPWLCHWLDRLGAAVTGYAKAPHTDPNNFATSRVSDALVAHHEHDIRDYDALKAALIEAQPDVIFHLAAQTVVREGYRSPRETFDVNVMGTAVLLDAVREIGEPVTIVVVTSDKCYRNVEQVWGYRETDALGDCDPYSASKGATELLVDSYRKSYFHPAKLSEHGVKLATARAGNVIGGGDWTADALIVDVVEALAHGETLELRCPHAVRPWQHVLEALSGYLTLAARMLESDDPSLLDAWNIGPLPGNELTVQQIVELFIDVWGDGAWTDASDTNQPHEANVLRLSIDKAMWQLDWRPRWNVREAVLQTARWYRHYFEGIEPMPMITREQISEYEHALVSNAPSQSRAQGVA
jgi:CDP-glucose 4,6-dehydratase